VIGLVVSDFLYYFQHVLNHKVPWFWYLHMVHHSQKELNFFTDFRYHVLEYVVRNTVLTIPFLILGFEAPTVIVLAFFVKWYGRFCHGNVRTNLGWLRYVFVTPQSHRVHHSREEKHVDMNCASIFSLWDFAFGTQYKGWNEYPDTGIVGELEFPHESKLRVSSLLIKPLQQMWHPLKLMGRDVKHKARQLGHKAASIRSQQRTDS
jgi:sterol desaturase/sphingolipid hydroxylase (fatty acid hydroxylase superfamily)